MKSGQRFKCCCKGEDIRWVAAFKVAGQGGVMHLANEIIIRRNGTLGTV